MVLGRLCSFFKVNVQISPTLSLEMRKHAGFYPCFSLKSLNMQDFFNDFSLKLQKMSVVSFFFQVFEYLNSFTHNSSCTLHSYIINTEKSKFPGQVVYQSDKQSCLNLQRYQNAMM